MTTARDDFKKWFVQSLTDLRGNGDAGFIFALVTFPLLERYLRNKSGCSEGKPLKDVFFKFLAQTIPGVAGKEYEFWDCYRNGLLHQVTFSKATIGKGGIWIALPPAALSGHDERPVYFDDTTGGFFLNPIRFFDHIVSMILADFSVYEGAPSSRYRVPVVYDPKTAQPGTTPTIGLRLTDATFICANAGSLDAKVTRGSAAGVPN